MSSRGTSRQEFDTAILPDNPVFQVAEPVQYQDGKAVIAFAIEYPGTRENDEAKMNLALRKFGELLLQCESMSKYSGPDYFEDLLQVLKMFKQNLQTSDERTQALLHPNFKNR